ncbi:hypothetical protein L873DRAFT_1797008 [Choiromyces venosus 120613-1]|uniref:Uncharacterized protein n=1 Tax=Choiromyces venosus 120613-1 TaxID=1336337 RepID=A0A3N4K9Q4_9PEZI|nr:hypothetical protein L873DRAFT_1797008 [Choiromyces venosus 120613-1]
MSFLIPLRRTVCLVPTCTKRTLTTTAAMRDVGPESPHYLDMPSSPVIRPYRKAPPKGKLPRPRPIVENAESTVQATLAPQEPRQADPAANEEAKAYIEWKNKMSSMRRRNLREGLTELRKRALQTTQRRKEALEKRNKERDELLNTAMREDVRLTLPSVLSTLRSEDITVMRRMTPERVEEKRQLRLAKEQEKKEGKMEMLHELYLNAREFLLTEKDLDEAIERTFRPQNALVKRYPPTMEDMLRTIENTGASFGADSDPRLLEVAGTLTGGKLPPSKREQSDDFKLPRY